MEFDWEQYLVKRPDLRKNWGTPQKAWFHYHFLSKYDSLRASLIKVPSREWFSLHGASRRNLLDDYGGFQDELRFTPNAFVKNPRKFNVIPSGMKSYTLFTHLYPEQNKKRIKEFLFCLDRNLAHNRIANVIVFYDNQDRKISNDELLSELEKRKIKIEYTDGRLTFQDAFDYANENYSDCNIILSNADIYFNKSLVKLDCISLEQELLSLTRWNKLANGHLKLFTQKNGSAYSQDAWIFRAPLTSTLKCDIPLGTPNCEGYLNNKILQDDIINISNPCLEIQACHMHLSKMRSDDLLAKLNDLENYEKAQELKGNVKKEVKWQRLLEQNTLRNVECVTFPRSGHRLLRECLVDYFENEFRFCEKYTHCNQVPCINPLTNYQKEHDFKLETPKIKSANYLIQFRQPLESLVSFYKFSLKHNSRTKDSKEAWEKFCIENVEYWRGFVHKWIIDDDSLNVIHIKYEEQIADTKNTLKRIIEFIKPQDDIDEEKLDEIINKKKIAYLNDITKFKHYDPKFFKKIEDSLKEEIEILKLKKYF